MSSAYNTPLIKHMLGGELLLWQPPTGKAQVVDAQTGIWVREITSAEFDDLAELASQGRVNTYDPDSGAEVTDDSGGWIRIKLPGTR